MERDFMGLISNDSALVVKGESVDGDSEDSVFAKSSSVPWSLSNKLSALPQFMSSKCEQDDKPSKNAHSANPIHDFKTHPSAMMSSPFLKARFMGACQNFGGAQQFLGGNPRPIPPPAGSAAGTTTEQWINLKSSTVSPPQMTIFYGGTVNVFDDISPEKAQAIMFLAGNGFMPSIAAQSKHHMQAPASKLPSGERPLVNQSMNMQQPCSGLPSPLSISSHPIDQTAVSNDEVKVLPKPIATSATLVNKVENPKVMSSMGSVVASAMISSAVPQARKASLARFLEKRKERAMSAAPYDMSKKSADCATPESNGFGFSATSGNCSTSIL